MVSNWGGGRPSSGGGDWFDRARPVLLMVVTLALLALGAALVVMDRYQIGQAGTLPARLDRFTGQVIACVPQRGCVEFIPAGDPSLQPVVTQKPAAPPAPAPAAAAPAK